MGKVNSGSSVRSQSLGKESRDGHGDKRVAGRKEAEVSAGVLQKWKVEWGGGTAWGQQCGF